VALEEGNGGVSVTFENESSRRFDLVIGADGLHSNTRQLVIEDDAASLLPLHYALGIFTTPNVQGLRDCNLLFAMTCQGT
jgi:2-polyprenyl-6-methoxyphenol hydroxylase-like FAD-dependent oxidoreductase